MAKDACDANCVTDATLLLAGTIYYYNGPFAGLREKPRDPTVKDAASAISHEYTHHIDPALTAVEPLIKSLEAKGFTSKEECSGECSAVSSKVTALFRSTLAETQRKEKEHCP